MCGGGGGGREGGVDVRRGREERVFMVLVRKKRGFRS